MNKEKTLAWFDGILARSIPTHEETIMAWSSQRSIFDGRPGSRDEGRVTDKRFDMEAINAWFTEAHVMLDSRPCPRRSTCGDGTPSSRRRTRSRTAGRR